MRVSRLSLVALVLGGGALGVAACGSADPSDGELPAVFLRYGDAVTVYRDGDTVVIEATGVPDHDSPYFDASDPRYAAYDGDNPDFFLGPGTIAEQDYTFRIPVEPRVAGTHAATPLGPIGIALNGVPFFNQYAGTGAPLGSEELNTFDQFEGHPTPMDQYHYHAEPTALTAAEGSDGLLGFLLDGFPVYGPTEGGRTITNADLDAYHGHTAATAEYPDGIYHYHVTDADPYINGAGFYGTPGTVSR